MSLFKRLLLRLGIGKFKEDSNELPLGASLLVGNLILSCFSEENLKVLAKKLEEKKDFESEEHKRASEILLQEIKKSQKRKWYLKLFKFKWGSKTSKKM